ncbi:LOW QUALITY PROTEIN: immediate early response gene 2 protein [Diretmus argenteus]
MEVSGKAKRIMVVALGKLYSSRTQRGGLRLHRSLLLTLVMKSARDIYHAAQATAESPAAGCIQQHSPKDTDTATDTAGDRLGDEAPPSPATRHSRTLPREDAGISAARCGPRSLTDGENKENRLPSGPERHSRKRRGKAAAEPDFLPCKKAKLAGEEPPTARVELCRDGLCDVWQRAGDPPEPGARHKSHRSVLKRDSFRRRSLTEQEPNTRRSLGG